MTVLCRLLLGVSLVLLGGCRFGQATGDGLEFGLADSEGYAGESAPPPEAAEPAEPPAAEVPARAAADGGAAGSRSEPVQASTAGKAASATPARTPPVADSCSATRQINGCDPISNQGCLAELGMQCDVDLLSDTPAGVCVFSAPPPNPDTCLNIPPTESCPPQSTCVGTTCAKICLCDADCDTGDCCTTPVGSGGFKVCGACG